MALYKVETNKRVLEYKWRNTWHVEAESQSAAVTAALELTDFEIAIHGSMVQFTTTTVGLVSDLTDDPAVLVINKTGTTVFTSNATRPEQVLRIDFQTENYPGRKLFRYCLQESTIDGYLIDPTRLSVINSFIQSELADLFSTGLLATADGDLIANGEAFAYVQNRQLRRKRKRVAPPTA